MCKFPKRSSAGDKSVSLSLGSLSAVDCSRAEDGKAAPAADASMSVLGGICRTITLSGGQSGPSGVLWTRMEADESVLIRVTDVAHAWSTTLGFKDIKRIVRAANMRDLSAPQMINIIRVAMSSGSAALRVESRGSGQLHGCLELERRILREGSADIVHLMRVDMTPIDPGSARNSTCFDMLQEIVKELNHASEVLRAERARADKMREQFARARSGNEAFRAGSASFRGNESVASGGVGSQRRRKRISERGRNAVTGMKRRRRKRPRVGKQA